MLQGNLLKYYLGRLWVSYLVHYLYLQICQSISGGTVSSLRCPPYAITVLLGRLMDGLLVTCCWWTLIIWIAICLFCNNSSLLHTSDSVEGMWWPQLFFVVPHLFLWMFDLSIVLAWTGVCSFAYWVLYHSWALCLRCVAHSLRSKR